MTVDVERMTFGQLLDEAARRYGDAEALVFKGERITYRGLKERVDALAAGLIELGVEPGDRVALWLHNRPEWVYAFFAVAKVGAVLVPMNTRLRTAEAEYVLRQSESSTVLLADEFRGTSYLGMLQELCPELPSSAPGRLHAQRLPDLRRVVVLGGTRHPGTFGFDEVVGLGERAGLGRLREREAAVRHEDPCLIMY
ncbi:MAG: AMP-binding protein, partial [Clostridia bacterium]|nr:AMP-binding protein [Clostridia bacterium]